MTKFQKEKSLSSYQFQNNQVNYCTALPKTEAEKMTPTLKKILI